MKKTKLFILVLSAILICTLAASCASTSSAAKASGPEALSLWTDEAPFKKAITEYVETTTKKGSADFIPVEHRIAVFDLDGTLFCETHPTYFDLQMFMYRVLDDPTFNPTQMQYKYAKEIRDTGKLPPLSKAYEKMNASAYAGMTLKEFDDFVRAFMETDQPGYANLKRKDAFYKPMVQLINYLTANDFTVFVSSGTDRFILRPLTEGTLHLPMHQIIGSDSLVVAAGQGDKDGMDYLLPQGEELKLAGDNIIKNLQLNNTTTIVKVIGVQPVRAFGNSMTDASMMNYALSNPDYKSLAAMVLCDDLDREYGKLDRAKSDAESCNKYGWIPVSMKNDWKTIYGENVKKTE